MTVIKPPNSIALNHRRSELVFLAGSIEMGVAENWQQTVEAFFSDKTTYTLLNPRRDEWDASWEQSFVSPQFYQQVNWELNGLERADHIILFLAPETKSPISLLELGLHANSGKLLVCCPPGFWRRGNVEIVAERYGIPLYEKLEDLLLRHFED
ncbi:nucleoside 2-deoxyribosyltransferase domain-containing protein [Neolewinella agarilytica]|uniref:nucleoside 2-deoxyribosyltransferase domain-containing protein n=1 Tax=Neolewinella agarilytica TaxID=478744 RepID=UPI002355B780|nr:nucleoside 2-deoxyribosyltransferase domain-containing protein [Neolewinella agarilytica]